MPAPIPVELVPHSRRWAEEAAAEAERWLAALGDNVVAVHHIGSTAIPGIHAKPILDLMPIVHRLEALDAVTPCLERLGYRAWGEYGIAGRRYFTLDDPDSGRRKVQAHCYRPDNPEVRRHLAFRDYLRASPDKAQQYDREKHRCRALHPDDSHAYTSAKAAWIAACLEEALQQSPAESSGARG